MPKSKKPDSTPEPEMSQTEYLSKRIEHLIFLMNEEFDFCPEEIIGALTTVIHKQFNIIDKRDKNS